MLLFARDRHLERARTSTWRTVVAVIDRATLHGYVPAGGCANASSPSTYT